MHQRKFLLGCHASKFFPRELQVTLEILSFFTVPVFLISSQKMLYCSKKSLSTDIAWARKKLWNASISAVDCRVNWKTGDKLTSNVVSGCVTFGINIIVIQSPSYGTATCRRSLKSVQISQVVLRIIYHFCPRWRVKHRQKPNESCRLHQVWKSLSGWKRQETSSEMAQNSTKFHLTERCVWLNLGANLTEVETTISWYSA